MRHPKSTLLDRRELLHALLGAAAIAAITAPGIAIANGSSKTQTPEIVIYKSPDCGCCGNWAKYLKRNGFTVRNKNVGDVGAIKKLAGVPEDLESCHTALISGYVIEGHVPAADIRRLLAEKQSVRGIAVPGMPSGSPGMGGEPEPFDVLIFGFDGKSRLFTHYR